MSCWESPKVGSVETQTHRADRLRRAILSTFGLIASGAVVVLCGLEVDNNNVTEAEISVFRAVNEFPSLFYRPAWLVMQLGNMLVVPALAVACVILRRFRLALAALLVGAGKWYASRLVKDTYFRQRPGSLLDDVVLRDAPDSGQAFVSGHAVIAIGLAVVLHPYLTRRGRILVWCAAFLVCLTRVYVGAHLPLDVVGGAAMGVVLGILANTVANAAGLHFRQRS
jgi:membrane-associated phospholipid phosphatase